MSRTHLGPVLIASLTLLSASGCGTSGSNPVLYPEVHFTVTPAGGAASANGFTVFSVNALVSSGVSHSSITPRQPYGGPFYATAPFDIVLENAAPPYQGVFTRQGGDDATVTLAVIAFTGQITVLATSSTNTQQDTVAIACIPVSGSPAGITCTSTTSTAPPPEPTPPAANPEVRFDVCSVSPDVPLCFTPPNATPNATFPNGYSGLFGVPYSGNLGDFFSTHLIGTRSTPAIYFLDDARDTANGVFQSAAGQLLQAELFINGGLRLTRAGTTGQLLLAEDL